MKSPTAGRDAAVGAAPPSRPGGAADGGFTLVEVIVSMLIFVIFMLAGVATLTQALRSSASERQRVVAGDLAARQMEIVRGLSTLAIPTTHQTTTVTVGAITYTVAQDANYVSDASGGSACTSTATSLAYKRVTVQVTWPHMNGVLPVRSDTLKTLGVVGLDPTKGAITVQVLDRNGQPQANIQVTATPQAAGPSAVSQVSGTDGCVILVGLRPGQYLVSVNKTGYVDDVLDTQYATRLQTVTASVLSKVQINYDRAAILGLTYNIPLAPPPYSAYTFVAIPNLPITLTNVSFPAGKLSYADCPAPTSVACASGNPRTVTPLYPYSAGYGAYAGDCPDAAPASPGAAIGVTPGVPTTGTVNLAGLGIVATNYTSTTKSVYVVHNAVSGGCVAHAYLLGSVAPGAQGIFPVALPYGTWYAEFANAAGAADIPASSGRGATLTSSSNQALVYIP